MSGTVTDDSFHLAPAAEPPEAKLFNSNHDTVRLCLVFIQSDIDAVCYYGLLTLISHCHRTVQGHKYGCKQLMCKVSFWKGNAIIC